ncbi:hypothetical protein KCTCHS21_45630 [Cohnella abietis]|uniref:Uncharacterized protein n=1 Tax=Cohnella abietis TaxID=2507935 RepID=A0A3T1DAV2_9BACL|nr:hypothetical protein KCTCHS21_45630 [Cohnella abietis]
MLNIIDIECGGIGIGDDYNIDKISFYRSRFGEIEIIDVGLLDDTKVEQAIVKLGKLWNLNLIV